MIDKYDEYNINYEYIVQYLHRTLKENQGYIKEMEQYAKENFVPISQPESIKFLEVLIRLTKPKKILEIGTAIGYSSIIFATCGSEVITIEKNEDMYKIANENIVKMGLQSKITVILGDGVEVLPKLALDENNKFDMIFLDAAKGQYNEFLPPLVSMLSQNGVLVSDNILYRGMIATDELYVRRKSTIIKRIREYLDYLCTDEKFHTSIIPIGDGIALTILNDMKGTI